MPVSYLPGLPAAARGCIETESEGGVDKGMDRRGEEGGRKKKIGVCACVLGLAGEFHWRGA